MTQSEQVFIADLGGALHAALRKCCDSRITNEAYGVIDKLDEEEWWAYLEHVSAGLRANGMTAAALKAATVSWKPQSPDGERLAYLFSRFADDGEWDGYAAYLEYLDAETEEEAQ